MASVSPSTVTHVVRDLQNQGLVLETGVEPTGKVGRSPVSLTLNPNTFGAIGIEIGDSRLVGLLLDMRGNVRKRIVTPVDPGTRLTRLPTLVAKLVDQLSKTSIPLLGIGIAIAGMIDRHAGTVFAPNLHGEPIDLLGSLSTQLPLSVTIENETNTMVLAEQARGILQFRQTALGVHVGLGIGGAMLIDGQLYTGSKGSAIEIGHMIVDVDGPHCSCGRRGCLEVFSGGKALTGLLRADSQTPNQEKPTVRAGFDTPFEQEDVLLLEKAARLFGLGLANAANLLNPEVIVLGGPHLPRYYPVFGVLRESYGKHVLPSNRDTEILEVTLTEPEALGAGIMVLNDFFGTPMFSAIGQQESSIDRN